MRARARWIVAGIGAVLATLVNPYGWHLWQFLWNTVGLGREQISDWQPVYALGTAYVVIWICIAGLSAALLVHHARRKTVDAAGLTLVILLAFAAFRVNRLLAFFAIASTTMLARGWSAAPERHRPAAVTSATSLWIAAGVGAILLSGALVVTAQNLSCVRMDDPGYPEPEAAPAMAAAGLHGRMLTYFDWGEYAIWYLPNLSVSLDGRRETVYSDAAVGAQVAMYFDPSTRQTTLDHLRPEYAWLPANLPLASALKHDGWTTIFAGPRSVVLSRNAAAPLSIPRVPGGRRCFPGP